MNKVVFNNCYGGFSISLKAVEWLEDNSEDEALLEHIENCKEDIEYSTSAYKNQMLCYSVSEFFDRKRHHKDLVAVVEALGDEANGSCAHLGIAQICGNQYRIEEYDGAEEVITPEDDSEWIVID
jgi:hypothetical protein